METLEILSVTCFFICIFLLIFKKWIVDIIIYITVDMPMKKILKKES